MTTKNLILIATFATSFCFAAEATQEQSAQAKQPNPVVACKEALKDASKGMTSKNLSAKFTATEATANLIEFNTAYENDPNSEAVTILAANCETYAQIIKVQVETQKLRDNIADNWEKRAATARSIEAIQEQINQIRSGKVNALETEMQQNQQYFQFKAQAQEKALTEHEQALANASVREAELQKKLAEEQAALAEERAKAEARQKEALDKLNKLQSKLIQVSHDARGIILSMSDILFDVNKATLKQSLKTSLAKVAGILSVYQQFNVSIEGNTDNTGSEKHNLKLSQQRANNVKAFLVKQGIEDSRLTAKGLGMSMPIADNSTKAGRAKNRRVDLVIQDKALQQQ